MTTLNFEAGYMHAQSYLNTLNRDSLAKPGRVHICCHERNGGHRRLKPAGVEGTWLQSVPLRKAIADGARSSFLLLASGKQQMLVDAVNYFFVGDVLRTESTVEAPIVLVGFGVTTSAHSLRGGPMCI